MKTAVGLLTLALALIVTPAAAHEVPLREALKKPRPEFLAPPPEYDRPYTGELILWPASTQKEVRDMCPGVKFLGAALGCAARTATSCFVVLAPEADMKAAGYPYELVKRHEIGHCNGWPGDHRGALPFVDWWAPDDTDAVPPPVLNAASQFDNFALDAVGKTVAEVAHNLAKSNWTAAAQFVKAAKGIGLAPESQLTGQVLSNPATAAPLARAAGIATDLSDDQWQQAHAIAWQASRARQAENAAPAAASQSVPNPGQAAHSHNRLSPRRQGWRRDRSHRPPEYDHPYDGFQVRTVAESQATCARSAPAQATAEEVKQADANCWRGRAGRDGLGTPSHGAPALSAKGRLIRCTVPGSTP